MLTLHHLNHSRSFRILWLLEELHASYGTPYEMVSHTRNANFLAPKEMTQIHPMGKAPILVDGTRGKTLVESGYIIEYLLKYYDEQGQFSADEEHWDDYVFWLHFSESSMMPPQVMRLVMSQIATKSPLMVRPVVRAIKNKVESLLIKDAIRQSCCVLDDHLKNREWLAGHFTGADIQTYFVTKALQNDGLNDCSNIRRWMTDCESRQAYQKSVLKGGELFV
ncbi:glutathione S-transferase [Moraxella sp. Tifton1]|uniref:glutathione S-transferase family protein n=1 Tax=Moraxella oculi TaxID=2940516 RepID=UPI0020122239|nr:glutathione S-transferase [Moraxella sp. Tifton1]MCL1622837.1 glutathione S-transferase [Moraxella sp. Tifton1]